MAGVFLSYRRKDGDYAVMLYAWLVERFGGDRVFWGARETGAITPPTLIAAAPEQSVTSSRTLLQHTCRRSLPSVDRKEGAAFSRACCRTPGGAAEGGALRTSRGT